MNHLIEFPRQKADTEQAIRDHIPAYEYDPPFDPIAEYEELRDRCAIYLGKAPGALTDADIAAFARLERWGMAVRR